MIVWWLWRAINRRPPVVSRYVDATMPASAWMSLSAKTRQLLEIAPGIFIILFFLLGLVNSGVVIVALLPFAIIMFIVGLCVILPGAFSGVFFSMAVASSLQRERVSGRYDMLSITPYGRYGAAWVLMQVTSKRSRIAQTILSLAHSVYILIGGLVAFSVITSLLMSVYDGGVPGLLVQLRSLEPFAVALVFMALLYHEVTASAVAGVLSGLILGRFALDELSAQVLALAAFLAGQLVYYVLVVLMFIVTTPSLFVVVLIFVLREASVLMVWGITNRLWYEDGARTAGLDIRPLDILKKRKHPSSP